MYDQVYRYLDLPGQVCENTAIISKTLCNFCNSSSLLSFFTAVGVCVCVRERQSSGSLGDRERCLAFRIATLLQLSFVKCFTKSTFFYFNLVQVGH